MQTIHLIGCILVTGWAAWSQQRIPTWSNLTFGMTKAEAKEILAPCV
jgi:hypothetical protein